LGIDAPIGLAVVRDLGSDEVPVYGIVRSATALGFSSRFLYQGFVQPDSAEELIGQLVNFGSRLGQACLFAI
jgi:hypothetical protein